MKKLIIIPLLLLFTVNSEATPVQAKTCSGTTNATCTLGSASGASNHVILAFSSSSRTDTISITAGGTPTTLLATSGHASTGISVAIFCVPGDGSTTAYTAHSASSAAIRGYALEISGKSCNIDGTAQSVDGTGTTTQNLGASPVVTTGSSSFIACIVSQVLTNTFSVTGTNFIPLGSGGSNLNDSTMINTVALGAYEDGITSGSYGGTGTGLFSVGSNTNTKIGCAAVQAASATPSNNKYLTLGIGE